MDRSKQSELFFTTTSQKVAQSPGTQAVAVNFNGEPPEKSLVDINPHLHEVSSRRAFSRVAEPSASMPSLDLWHASRITSLFSSTSGEARCKMFGAQNPKPGLVGKGIQQETNQVFGGRHPFSGNIRDVSRENLPRTPIKGVYPDFETR